jgi:hypothetical protein
VTTDAVLRDAMVRDTVGHAPATPATTHHPRATTAASSRVCDGAEHARSHHPRRCAVRPLDTPRLEGAILSKAGGDRFFVPCPENPTTPSPSVPPLDTPRLEGAILSKAGGDRFFVPCPQTPTTPRFALPRAPPRCIASGLRRLRACSLLPPPRHLRCHPSSGRRGEPRRSLGQGGRTPPHPRAGGFSNYCSLRG